MSTRLKRIESMIAQALREAFVFNLDNPELKEVEITAVHLTPDLRLARVNYVLGGLGAKRDHKREAELEKRLKRVSGFLRARVNEKVDIKYSPELEFFYDEGREKEFRIEQILQDLKNE